MSKVRSTEYVVWKPTVKPFGGRLNYQENKKAKTKIRKKETTKQQQQNRSWGQQ
jgi:hypothetical protein